MIREKLRENLLKYTRQAYQMFPKIDKPRILDIGCGSGVPTLELARLSNGDVTGTDIDQPALDEFSRRIIGAGLADRVRAFHCPMSEMDFLEESFDIVWAEGSIYAIGFSRGLQEWKRLLKPGGFLVVHDEQGNIQVKLKQISDAGYQLLGHFNLSSETWRKEYFGPLEELVAEAETWRCNGPKLVEELKQSRIELDMFREFPERNNSTYFVMKKAVPED